MNKDDRALIDTNTKAIMELADAVRNQHNVATGATAETQEILQNGFAALEKQQILQHGERSFWRLEDKADYETRGKPMKTMLGTYVGLRILMDMAILAGVAVLVLK